MAWVSSRPMARFALSAASLSAGSRTIVNASQLLGSSPMRAITAASVTLHLSSCTKPVVSAIGAPPSHRLDDQLGDLRVGIPVDRGYLAVGHHGGGKRVDDVVLQRRLLSGVAGEPLHGQQRDVAQVRADIGVGDAGSVHL